MAYLLGVLAMVVGIPLSIALHEIGHLVPAKAFGIKCTQYMIGFGATLWSRRIGETEYGFKAIPLGGYVRMIGMYPPRSARAEGRGGSGRWSTMIEQARQDARAEVGAGDEGRQFYQRPVWQRVIVMLGGPAMNLVLASVIIGGVVMGYGIATETTKVGTVSRCVLPVDAPADATCSATDRPAPAAAAGLLPGDRLVRFAGQDVTSWKQVRELIRSNGDKPVPVTVERDGARVEVALTPISAPRPLLDDDGNPLRGDDGKWRTETVGFAGISPQAERVRQPVTVVPGIVWEQVSGTAGVVLAVPAKLFGVAKAALGLQERDPTGPVSVIGVGRMAGEVASGRGISADSTPAARAITLLTLLAGLNLALFVFNLVPLLPLDGGHVAGALWEGLRRSVARVLRRPDPGPVDTVRALPLIYAVASALIVMSVLLMYADIVSPVKLGG